MEVLGNTVAVADTSSPGTTIYTAPAITGKAVRIQVRAVSVGATALVASVEYDVGSGHPLASAGIVKLVDAYQLPIVGLPILIADVVLYGDSSDPDKLTAFVASGTVNFIVEAEVL